MAIVIHAREHRLSRMPPPRPLRILAWPGPQAARTNPYPRMLAAALARGGSEVADFTPLRLLLGRWDVWHLHFPDGLAGSPMLPRALFNLAGLWLLVRAARLKGTAIVWTAHSLQCRDVRHPRLDALFWRFFPRSLDAVLALSQAGLALAFARLPALAGVPGFVAVHGHYRNAYPRTTTRRAARRRLMIAPGDRVLAAFGTVLAHKNVPGVVAAFRQAAGAHAALIVAGCPADPAEARAVTRAAGGDVRVRLHLRTIAPGRVQHILLAADAVVFAHDDLVNSGAVMLALSFDRPVIVPRTPTMAELQRDLGSEWIFLHDGAFAADTVAAALDWVTGTARPRRAPLEGFGWDRAAEETLAVYRRLALRPARADAI